MSPNTHQEKTVLLHFPLNQDSASSGTPFAKARILYNHITGNEAEFGGGIGRFDGLIEGNLIEGNQATDSGGGINEARGVIRKNFIRSNTATSLGGGIAYSDGPIVQNFIVENTAASGGGLYTKVTEVKSNLIVENTATGSGGGGIVMEGTNGVIFEHNTVFKNHHASSGAGMKIVGQHDDEVIRNNIVWENDGPQVTLSGGTAVLTHNDIQGGFTGTGNINSDPLFLHDIMEESTTNLDNFEDGNWTANPAWSCTGTWTVPTDGNGSKVMDSTVTASWRSFQRNESNPDFEAKFSYKRENNVSQTRAYFTMRDNPSTGDTIQLLIYADKMILREYHPSTYTTWWTNTSFTSEQDKWYDVHVKLYDETIEVWRRKREDGGPFIYVGGTDDVTVPTGTRYMFQVAPSADWRFDDITIKSDFNLDEFLQLGSGSPCIDVGFTPTLNDIPIPFRDFGDQLGPFGTDGDPETPAVRDIGADEFPNVPRGVYWWRRF